MLNRDYTQEVTAQQKVAEMYKVMKLMKEDIESLRNRMNNQASPVSQDGLGRQYLLMDNIHAATQVLNAPSLEDETIKLANQLLRETLAALAGGGKA